MRIRDLQWKRMPAWPPEWWSSDEGAGDQRQLFFLFVLIVADQRVKRGF